jgi:preprotein translocase subunit SecB
MNIQLENWRTNELIFTSLKEQRIEDNNFDLKSSNFFLDDDSRTFGVEFKLDVKDKSFDININMTFIFKLDEDITEQFKLSNFPKINAPAIAFPYLRSFISNITLQAGYLPVILPSINFVKLAEEVE